jgi:hypothetical protein
MTTQLSLFVVPLASGMNECFGRLEAPCTDEGGRLPFVTIKTINPGMQKTKENGFKH